MNKEPELASNLSLDEFVTKRRKRLRAQMKTRKIPALLVTSPLNVTYLTGFTGDSSFLVLTGEREILLSDSRYAVQIAEECPGLECEIRTARTPMFESIETVLKGLGAGVCGYESGDIRKSFFDELESKIGLEWVSTSGLVEELRAVKDKYELTMIRRSIRINERAFEAVVARLTPEFTELQVAHELEHQMRSFGATHASFDPIVGVGERGALPHAKLTERRLGEAEFVLIDWGARYQGYASDLTRVLVTSKKIPAKFRKVYGIVLQAQLAAIKKIRPGVRFQDVDAAARKVIETAGFGKNFGHGLGHGFGLQIHEHPFLSPIKEGVLETNMVVTVEPGIYLPGWGGVRIEDDVLVTRDGCEVMSRLGKQLEDCLISIS